MEITKSFGIAKNLEGTEIIEIFTPSTATQDEQSYSYSALLEELTIYAKISSLAPPALPTELENAAPLQAIHDFKQWQWNSPHFVAKLFLKENTNWIEIAAVPLLAMQPFFQIDIKEFLTTSMAFRIAHGHSLGIQITDGGFGLPGINDSIRIFGCGLEELDLHEGMAGGASEELETLQNQITQESNRISQETARIDEIISTNDIQGSLINNTAVQLNQEVSRIDNALAQMQAEIDSANSLQAQLNSLESVITQNTQSIQWILSGQDTLFNAIYTNELSISLENGWTTTDGFKILKTGKLAFVYGTFRKLNYSPSSAVFCTLPVGYRPRKNFQMIYSPTFALNINSQNGSCSLDSTSGTSAILHLVSVGFHV